MFESILIALSLFKVKALFIDFTLLALLCLVALVILDRIASKQPRNFIIDKVWIGYYFIISFGFLYFFLVEFIMFAYQGQMLLVFFRFTISYVTFLIVFGYFLNGSSDKEVLIAISRVTSFFLWLCIAQLAIPSVKQFSYELFVNVGHIHWYRVTGFMNGTSSAGLYLGLLAILWLYTGIVYRRKYDLALVAISMMLFPFTAVSGFVVFLGGFIVLMIRYKPIAKKGVVVSVAMVCIAIFSYNAIDREGAIVRAVGLNEALLRIDALLGKDANVRANPRRSLDKLQSTYDLPEGLQLVIGNGFQSKHPEATTHSDAGIIGNLHAYGLIGSAFIAISLLYPVFVVGGGLLQAMCIGFLIIYLKNDLVYSRVVFDFYLSIFFAVTLKNRKLENVTIFFTTALQDNPKVAKNRENI